MPSPVRSALVDDRLTYGLFLEMTEIPADVYGRERAPELRAHEAVTRVTWWRNMKRDRTDLPRVLPEFDTLGIAEVEPEFVAPDAPAGISTHHFIRTPRPGQGGLSAKETVGLSLVLISPREPHQAQALRDWGDFVHIRHIAAVGVPGMTMITPYVNASGGDPLFLHFYEMDDPDAERVFKGMTPRVTEQLGGYDVPAWKHWATCPELRIIYVNSFTRVGAM